MIDSAPPAVRGFLLVLVVCLHVAGAAALSRMSWASELGEERAVLRASWIEDAPSLSPPSASIQAAEPLSAPQSSLAPRRSAQEPERRTRSEAPAPLQLPAVQPAPEDIPPAVAAEPVASEDPDPRTDISTTMAALAAGETVAGETAGGEGENRGEEGRQSGDYVGPNFNVSYFSNPEPDYPSASRRLREQGLVKLRVHVTVEGRAGEVTLHTSSGFDRLDRAALDAVKRWRFRPARRAGTPVAGWVVVPVRFELHG
ncbi:MAG: energy transducer TonB [Betaproteobacteria bacterium]|nr:energy transducer TonB [Betaproteobacteria bacterium]